MTKQTINLGATVDDSTGDYLRQGGKKINENFDTTFSELGDGAELHPAGAWKTHNHANGSTLTPVFGSQYNINSLGGSISITLPKGSVMEYGRVIKIRDVHASWGTNSVSIRPSSGDSIGGSTNPIIFNGDFTTLEFVYSSPATWRFIQNMKLDSIPRTEGAGVISRTFRVTSTRYTDGFFTDIGPTGYNTSAVQVYRNGTLLTYDSSDNFANSDYSSRGLNNTPMPLNGVDIYIPYVIAGDDITIISYTKDVTAAPVSYIRYDIRMQDPNNPTPLVPGQSAYINMPSVPYKLTDFGRPSDEEFNPSAFQLYLNGTLLVEAGRANLLAGEGEDYKIVADANGKWNSFTVTPELNDGAILSLVYFNNELGSILEWDGTDGIKNRVADVFLDSEYRFNRSNKIRYSNIEQPNAETAVPVAGTEVNIRFGNVIQLLESIYPVGSIYINANNPNDPYTYMGFGTWRRFAKGRAIFGFDDSTDIDGNPDPIFGVNDAIRDEEDEPLRIAGNLIGSKQVELGASNIPALTSSIPYLRESVNGQGDINLSGCLPMPGEDFEPLASYELATVTVNQPIDPEQRPEDITIIPPGITAYVWVRVA